MPSCTAAFVTCKCADSAKLLQLLTKIGVLPPLPIWVDAGKVWIESHPSFPLGALTSAATHVHKFTLHMDQRHVYSRCINLA